MKPQFEITKNIIILILIGIWLATLSFFVLPKVIKWEEKKGNMIIIPEPIYLDDKNVSTSNHNDQERLKSQSDSLVLLKAKYSNLLDKYNYFKDFYWKNQPGSITVGKDEPVYSTQDSIFRMHIEGFGKLDTIYLHNLIDVKIQRYLDSLRRTTVIKVDLNK